MKHTIHLFIVRGERDAVEKDVRVELRGKIMYRRARVAPVRKVAHKNGSPTHTHTVR